MARRESVAFFMDRVDMYYIESKMFDFNYHTNRENEKEEFGHF